jgi:hypothetical protein
VSRGSRVLAVGAGLAAAAFVVSRPRLRRWGASEDEARGRLPGDELVGDATYVSTRAVTIDAPPASVWQWLVQIGQGRGGMYSYDRLERAFGLDMESADRIVPELQQVEAGDHISLGKGAYLAVHAVDPERSLVLLHPDGDWSWVFALQAPSGGQARLLARNRWTTVRAAPAERAWLKLAETIGFVMERKMLHGIKARAEREWAAGATGPHRPTEHEVPPALLPIPKAPAKEG